MYMSRHSFGSKFLQEISIIGLVQFSVWTAQSQNVLDLLFNFQPRYFLLKGL